ncbi:2-amino-4-hydroxy-6-hydroxymethyldihydropteridine diphosphokinase [Salinibacterium sp. SYSU T00001]|uniref:2-amino-4-hydroxy-6- hydroxymethyldihydropteridine diphosphokinase n=1 Tax=Homoserinimonas sedimenticola TaxID=2986805 RepID=UPI002236C013|nr:2-amino-4-hydroxy-6-hydroxymethyldihydropteridine diphosphokinase [Salinibacterium sedimenticola]MCW4385405.1 2-amino-4-hydroxy-6-hydroxymethyldihydropteridine diphosphokinase [Salinibacterium sedimenticola]
MTGPVLHRERAVIALGSNLGDREATLRSAVAELAATEGIRLLAASGLVETPAVTLEGVDRTAPAYLNAVVIAQTTLAPLTLLDALARIEDAHGRVREQRWGDRTLDLDLIALDDLELMTERLTLPHPRAHERAFVLVPWLQADPDATLPGHGAVRELLAALNDGDVSHVEAEPLLAPGVGPR